MHGATVKIMGRVTCEHLDFWTYCEQQAFH